MEDYKGLLLKDFKQLFKYRDYYEYSFDCEAIRVLDGEFHDEATALYSHIVKDCFLKDSEKWALDIALDCIKNFTDDECNIIKEQQEIFDYHLGYGMYVRNHYVHSSKFHSYRMAESVSAQVSGYIYTILLPIYNCLSEEFMALISENDFDDIEKQHGSTQPIINRMKRKLANWEPGLTAKDAMDIIRATIRKNLGRDGFKNILLPIAEEHIKEHKRISVEWKELIDTLYSKTRIYYKEYNQFKAVHEIHGFTSSLKTVEEAQHYIMDNLGFSYLDSRRLAECVIAIKKMEDEIDEVFKE